MPLSDRQSTVAAAIYALIVAHKADADLLIQDVFYPDQQKIPRTPAVAVEPGLFKRTIAGIGGKGQTNNEFNIFLLVYLCKVQDIQLTRQTVEELADSVMDVLHLDVTLGGLVTHSHVTQIEPGYATRQGNLFRVARITWEAFTKTAIA